MSIKRRELFSSLSSSFLKKEEKKEKIIRPPYHINNEQAFYEECANCEGLCKEACEEEIIILDDDKTPIIDFSNSGCSYCDDCAQACQSDVLKPEYKQNINVNIEIDILKCLSWNQTMCFSCKDPCLDMAIDFIAMFRPQINDNCTACGYCIKYCPTQAISIS